MLPAEWNLAVAYEKGRGIPRDYKQARYWYEQGAHAGDKQSEERLGELLYLGQGGNKDREAAIRWLTAAADQGNVSAAVNLGKVLSDDEASITEHISAVTWFAIARRRGREPGEAFASAEAHLSEIQRQQALENADKWLSAHYGVH